MSGMPSTLKDVSRLAGVSTATVSRFINDSGRLSDDTAQRVRAAIATLGFRPNAIGRSLKTTRSKALGIVIPSLSNPVFAEAVAGISREARAQGYSLMVTATDYCVDEELQVVNTLLDHQVDGLILTVSNPDSSAALDVLDREGVPYMLIYNQPTDQQRATVTIDNVRAGWDVACQLCDLGHQRFAMLTGALQSSDRAEARRLGFTAGVEACGFAPPVVHEVDFSALDAREAIDTLFRPSTPGPTALFCSNDVLAIAAIGALRERGIAVPDAVSVVGFDGIGVGALIHPQLTTVVQPSGDMGTMAARAVLRMITVQAAPGSVMLPYFVRDGESTGRACKHGPVALQESNPPVLRST